MSKNEIISALFVSKEFNECIAKMEPEYLQEDLKSEITLILLEAPEDLIMDLHYKNELRYYATSIIIKQAAGNRTPFQKKFRKLPIIAESAYNPFDEAEVVDRKLKAELALENVETLDFYDREILNLYGRLGSYRKIGKATGIPWESTYSTAKKAINKIRKAIAHEV